MAESVSASHNDPKEMNEINSKKKRPANSSGNGPAAYANQVVPLAADRV